MTRKRDRVGEMPSSRQRRYREDVSWWCWVWYDALRPGARRSADRHGTGARESEETRKKTGPTSKRASRRLIETDRRALTGKLSGLKGKNTDSSTMGDVSTKETDTSERGGGKRMDQAIKQDE